MNISVEFKKLIAFEINRSTNLHDLIYMTDRYGILTMSD